MEKMALSASILISIVAFAFATWLYLWVKRQPSSNKIIAANGELIRQGARTFLRKEYLVLAKFAGVAGILILILLPSPIWKGDVAHNILMKIGRASCRERV